jgi:hypothetical protein
MAAVVGKDSRVTACEIEGTGCGRTEEDGCATSAVEEVEPFCCVGVPMKLSDMYYQPVTLYWSIDGPTVVH